MGKRVLIIAESGSGKSHSMQFLEPKETFIINVASKDLPFKGWKSKYPEWTPKFQEGRLFNSQVDNGKFVAKNVLDCLDYINVSRPEIKNVIIDDYQYISAFEFFHRSDEKGYEKFSDIGNNIMKTAEKPMYLRDDLMVFYLTHSEEITDSTGRSKQKAKTIGRLVDDKLTLEGLFPIVLYGRKRDNLEKSIVEFGFDTKANTKNTCKSPEGMFESEFIPNNLQLVREAILNYEKE